MDTALKQRLIGAIVLVALAVIFLPMLVKGPAPDSGVSDIPLKVPDAPAGQYETRELPLVTPGDAPANGAVGLSTPAPSSDAAAPADTRLMPAATAGGHYAVSFGAYASASDADAVIARLRQANLPGYSEPTTINGRPAFRVRIGPYADQATAEAMRLEAVKVRSDVKAQVVVLDAGADAATPAASTAAATTTPTPTPSVAQAATTAPAVTTQTLPPEPARPATQTSATATTPARPASTPPAATTAATTTRPAAPAPRPAAPAPAVEKPAEVQKPAAADVGYAVQLGAFSNAADANALRDRVRAGGYSAFVEQVRTDKGTLSRVRVGPVANRAEADQLKAQIASKFGISGMVRPHP